MYYFYVLTCSADSFGVLFSFSFSFPLPLPSTYLSILLALCNPIKLVAFFLLSQIFYCCYKPLLLLWAFLQFYSCMEFSFSLSLSLFNFIFLTYYYFCDIFPLFPFPTVLSPLQLIFNVYKSSLSTSI